MSNCLYPQHAWKENMKAVDLPIGDFSTNSFDGEYVGALRKLIQYSPFAPVPFMYLNFIE